MTSRSGPVYEVTFFVDPDIAEDFDAWLEEHVRAALHEAGITDCRALELPDDDAGRVRRTCLYITAGDEALDDFLDGRGTDIETVLAERFAEQVSVRSRLLREDRAPDVIPGASPNCLNCGTRLRGQYCGTCGQRSRSRLISLWELISDAFGDLFELDSRLWQTLIPLLGRPGRLTRDYLEGRRARFMPPFRMYLVLSLLFFLVAFFDPREELGLLFEPQPETTTEEESAEEEAAAGAAVAEAMDEVNEVLEELEADGIIVGGDLPEDLDIAADEFRFELGTEIESDGECNFDASDLEDLPGWLARRLTVERLQRICEQTRLDDGRALVDNLIDNIPAALIVLLPLMALVLKALYPLSKRYYVEHLLFFVHFHAFFFLLLSLQILFARLGGALAFPEPIVVLTLVFSSFYVPVYLFVGMRRVYGQGRIVTFLKYVVLLTAYLAGFIATMLAALAIAAFSI